MDWQVFEHGGRVLAWNRASGETQVGAPLLWGGENIGGSEGGRFGQQFKFAEGERAAERSAESAGNWASCMSEDSEYASNAGGERGIRRPHKGRCSEPRRAPKCKQGRPLRAVGPAGPVRSPVGHGHVINQACNMRMSTCAGLEAAVTSPRFAGLPVLVRVSRVNGLPDSRRRDF